MVIIDLNHIIISAFFYEVKGHTNVEIEERAVLKLGLNVISTIRKKFKSDHTETVIACDSPNSWRKTAFPYYKAARKKIRQESDVDWPELFNAIETLKKDLITYFPYKTIQVENAEADDIIASICLNISDDIVIVSNDKDFLQLQNRKNVKQYDFFKDRWMEEKHPERFLFEHILSGDRTDGIPNVLSDDNCLVIGKRQTALTEKRRNLLTEDGIGKNENNKYHKNYMRNKQLIDLTEIPKEISDKIIAQYNIERQNVSKQSIKKYFMHKRMGDLFDKLNDF